MKTSLITAVVSIVSLALVPSCTTVTSPDGSIIRSADKETLLPLIGLIRDSFTRQQEKTDTYVEPKEIESEK